MKLFDVTFGPRSLRAIFMGLAVTGLSAASALAPAANPFGASANPAANSIASLDFDKIFNDQGEARQMHYRASYSIGGKAHQVEIWRDRNQRLKRRTDDAIETFIFKAPKEVEWQMVVLDLKRRIRTDIDRTNLYKIGHFTDWFSQSHSLTRPTAAYRLSAMASPPKTEKPLAACRWYTLVRNEVESRICWSSALRLPLLVLGSDNQVQWQVTAADSAAIPASVYQIQDQGFVRNDANEDIRSD